MKATVLDWQAVGEQYKNTTTRQIVIETEKVAGTREQLVDLTISRFVQDLEASSIIPLQVVEDEPALPPVGVPEPVEEEAPFYEVEEEPDAVPVPVSKGFAEKVIDSKVERQEQAKVVEGKKKKRLGFF